MPIIATLSELFQAGASFIAEQFARGTTKFGTLGELLGRKYGEQLQATEGTISALESRVRQAAIPASQINQRINVQLSAVPLWEGDDSPASFIHSGLAKVTAVTGTDTPVFSTNVPFNFRSDEILKLEDIVERIRNAFDGSPSDVQEKYNAGINRIEQLIRFHRIMQTHETINPELYGVYRSGA